tara:strand:+ start:330 stop:581 length:252 start_codon:yes stop_codon:yes gene_type:complete
VVVLEVGTPTSTVRVEVVEGVLVRIERLLASLWLLRLTQSQLVEEAQELFIQQRITVQGEAPMVVIVFSRPSPQVVAEVEEEE